MAKISYSDHAVSDLERISEFLAEDGPNAQLETRDLIDEAIVVVLAIRHQREAAFHG